MKTPNRINLLNDHKINDYNLSSAHQYKSASKGTLNEDFGQILDFNADYLPSPEDSMTEE